MDGLPFHHPEKKSPVLTCLQTQPSRTAPGLFVAPRKDILALFGAWESLESNSVVFPLATTGEKVINGALFP